MIARDLGKFTSASTKGCSSLTRLCKSPGDLGKRTKPRLGVSPRAANTVLAMQNRLCSPLSLCFPQAVKWECWRRLRFSFKDAIFGDWFHLFRVFVVLLTSLFFSWRVRWLVCKTVGCEHRAMCLWHPDAHLCCGEVWWAEACDRLLWQHRGLLGMELRSQDPALPGAHGGGWVASLHGFPSSFSHIA